MAGGTSGTADRGAAGADRSLPLRERKRLRTRQSLVATALERYTRDGFESTTLDDITDEVEISKRTFFRYFTSKEDVALAPQKLYWEAHLELLGELQPSGSLVEALHRAHAATLERMDEGWESQFLVLCRLIGRTPQLAAHSLRHCAETTEVILALLGERLAPLDPSDPRLRIALDIAVSAWRCAVQDWTVQRDGGGDGGGDGDGDGDGGGRGGLAAHMERAFASVAGALALTVPAPESLA
ncbi:TetR family transcriptional regulator [Streptomyces sp. NPDC004126]|uniref:TetR family transcriptional regulator n=1 Tax=Streptomyces sp. NPDC004126 TaxID=3390695 RepID=UPI003CFE2492